LLVTNFTVENNLLHTSVCATQTTNITWSKGWQIF